MMEMGGEGTGDIFDKLPGWDMIRWNVVRKTEHKGRTCDSANQSESREKSL